MAKLTICLLFTGFIASALFGIVPTARATEFAIDQVQTIIRSRLDRDPATISLSCQGEMICGIQMLPLAYRDRKHLPLWIDTSLRLEKAEALAEAIDRAGEDGLLPMDYHQDAIHVLLAEICEQSSAAGPASVSPELWADLDLILTDAYLLYGSHLAAGRVNPETLHTDWKINPSAVDLAASLAHAASTGDINAALKRLRPTHSGYMTLRHALAQLRGLSAASGERQCEISVARGGREAGQAITGI